jgi:hypothetical protein
MAEAYPDRLRQVPRRLECSEWSGIVKHTSFLRQTNHEADEKSFTPLANGHTQNEAQWRYTCHLIK